MLPTFLPPAHAINHFCNLSSFYKLLLQGASQTCKNIPGILYFEWNKTTAISRIGRVLFHAIFMEWQAADLCNNFNFWNMLHVRFGPKETDNTLLFYFFLKNNLCTGSKSVPCGSYMLQARKRCFQWPPHSDKLNGTILIWWTLRNIFH